MKDTCPEAVGARIRGKRKQIGMTIDQLAEVAGLSSNTIKQIEAGNRNFRYETLIVISTGLGVTTNYLLGLEKDEYSRAIVSLLSGLPDDEAEFCLGFMRNYVAFRNRHNSGGV